MFKLKPLTFLLIGLLIAFAVWGVTQLLQGDAPLRANTATPLTEDKPPNDYEITPATIQTAVYRGERVIISGNGVPSAQVILKHSLISGRGGEEISSVQVNDMGKWTLSFMQNGDEDPLALVIVSTMLSGQAVSSDETLFVVSAQEAALGEEELQPPPSILLLLSAPGSQSRVLHAPLGGLPNIDGFTLETIDYDNSGGVIFSGSSAKKGAVVAYLRGRPVVETQVDQNGRWSLISGNTMPVGTYKIGAQLFPEDGSAQVKLTLPFERLKPFSEQANSPKILVTRNEKYTLIARALYGGGYQYTIVYTQQALEP